MNDVAAAAAAAATAAATAATAATTAATAAARDGTDIAGVVEAAVDDRVRAPALVTISAESSTVITAAELAINDDDQVDAAVKVIAPPTDASNVTGPVIPTVFAAMIVSTTVIVPAEPVAGTKLNPPLPTLINPNSLLSTAIDVALLAVAPNTLAPSSIPPHTLVMVAEVAAEKPEVVDEPNTRSSPVNEIDEVDDRVEPAPIVTAPAVAPVAAQPTSATTTNPLAPLAVNDTAKLMVLLLINLVNTAADVDAVAVTVIEPEAAVPRARVVESTPAKKSNCGVEAV